MEKNMNEEYDDNDDVSPEEEEKILEAFLTFNKHFADYIKETDKALFDRACDYAKTFTEEDVSGISLNYIKDQEKNEEN